MAQVVLFHSVLGLRPGVADAAERLRAAGHTVRTPDLFDGRVFDDYEHAFAHVDELSMSDLLGQATEAIADLPPDLVYAGFSLGGGVAELLAAARPGARGAILLHGATPVEAFEEPGIIAWPSGVPAQVHYASKDPYYQAEEIAGFEADLRSAGVPFEMFHYPGGGHLFTDGTLPLEYNATNAELLFERVLTFLARIDRG